ncbi:hypothetical protein RCC89_14505 [Cytophagaceae bacterium ABcell3]|nr:hypothetical protein RCC89_14505 [Cytophagaceae bacterium ABcell3]
MMKTALCFLLTLSACVVNDATVTDTCTFNDIRFELITKNDKAYLVTEQNGQLSSEELKLDPPCYFLRKDSSVQSYSYKEPDAEVIIIVGNLLDEERKAYFGADQSMVCGEKALGVLIMDGLATLSNNSLSGGIVCKDYGLDEKDFRSFLPEER